ncbi:MAG: aspartate dehydrogenase [Rhizobiaceae bacterium]|nr:aspartate dehydrogenase [Rhizobiaceae bacterium]MCV0407242.1 aspartate dehydrogenase [Rhizobiaceae bacterium]
MDRGAMKERRILVIGYGAIASDLVSELLASKETNYALGLLLRLGSSSRQKAPENVAICESIDEASAFRPDLVVEAAGHAAVRESVPALLQLGLPVLVSSIGALHDDALLTELVDTADAHGGHIILASGALGGLDYVRATRGANGLDIVYQSRKPPAAWAGELEALGHEVEELSEPVTLFEGTAREAAASYPQNLNVAAALALAGPGFEGVRVAVVCDPAAKGNSHVVTAKSELGTMRIEIVNRPSPANPKSSWVVARSLLAAIRQHFSPLRML